MDLWFIRPRTLCFWCWQIHYEGKWEGFGPWKLRLFWAFVKWHRSVRRVPFGAPKSPFQQLLIYIWANLNNVWLISAHWSDRYSYRNKVCLHWGRSGVEYSAFNSASSPKIRIVWIWRRERPCGTLQRYVLVRYVVSVMTAYLVGCICYTAFVDVYPVLLIRIRTCMDPHWFGYPGSGSLLGMRVRIRI